ncbi:MAG: phenylalanine--tRNA ligase subunit beta [Bacteroidetes bacterium]|jgi:phenylalanyl-tRNA synthetase beta chain|nr:phenylalanine--tRNA ligase subunit beta [Bacteroidota bacterium]
MKISYNWLKEFIEIDLSPEQVAEILTNTGLEVEVVEHYESIPGGLEGFVIGEVLTCDKHPNADKLSVTTVDIGSNIVLPIVCGAPNVASGQKVVVATVGSKVHTPDGAFEIKKARLRGEPSEGMICAEDEIGLSDNHDGIMVLPDNLQPGTPAKDYFKPDSDVVFEIGLTPNRIDAASHIGVARDIAAFLRQNRTIDLLKPDVSNFKPDNHNLHIPVRVENEDACKRYSGLTISDITIGPSPEWIQKRLKAIGLNPINNVVDITNYVLHETGHPLHAFDLDKMAGPEVVVRTTPKGTKFKALDEEVYELTEQDLMICDAEKPACIGGVFGGIDSGVTGTTKSIFLESAYFDPVWVRKTAKYHLLNTDSSFRFERGADPNCTVYALKRAAMLIREYAGGKIASDVIDIYPNPIAETKIKVYFKNVDRLIGKIIERPRITNILRSLEIEVLDETDEGVYVSIPSYRVDVTREADVIEEILRIYGYNNVEVPDKINSSLSYSPPVDNEKLVNLISDYLSSNGFAEIMSNSLTKSAYYNNLETHAPDNTVKLLNPISSDLDGMRQTLLFSGLEAIRYNANRQHPDLRLYEFGNCYKLKHEKSDNKSDNYHQYLHLGIFMTGLKAEPNWNTPEQKYTIYTLKKYAEGLMRRLGLSMDELKISPLEGQNDLYSEGLIYKVNHKIMAKLLVVNKHICESFDIKEKVYFGEIFWENLVESVQGKETIFKELPKFPEVKRDLSMIIDKEIKFTDLKAHAFKVEKKYLKRVNIFDTYEGKNIPEGKKSYALSFILQDEQKTLNEKQIDKIMYTFIHTYAKEFNAEIRQ